MDLIEREEEKQAKKAFDTQSPIFDSIYSLNPIIQYKRSRVRAVVLKLLKSGCRILELNAGTGEDAVFFAQKGFLVHATDISDGMQKVLREKAVHNKVDHFITAEICSFTDLHKLEDKGPYDLIFSNFAGLNCTDRLDKVLLSFPDLLKPNGAIVLTMLPPFCFWEIFLALKGNFKSAFRRFFAKNGANAQIENVHFKCWYYRPGFIINILKQSADLLDYEGLCTIVPPSYMESFPVKYPKLYKRLIMLENRFKTSWPWKNIGDYYIISFRKKG